MKKVAGVDLGLNGALALVSDDTIWLADMPTFKANNKKKLDTNAVVEILESIARDKEVVFFIERQQPYPKQGVNSVFTLGEQFGFLKGVLRGMRVPHQEIHPKKWQKMFGINKNEGKHMSYSVASGLFPHAKLKTERGRVLDGRCDALLIAECGKRSV